MKFSMLPAVTIIRRHDGAGTMRVIGLKLDGVAVKGLQEVTTHHGLDPLAEVTVRLVAKDVDYEDEGETA